jgi:hypothetical protein
MRWLWVSTMSKANLSEACNTLEVSRVFLLGCTQTKRDTRYTYTRAHTHTHILQVENGSVWLPDWPVVICGHYSKVYQRSQKQGLVWCARHKKHTSTTATLESWFWSGWLEATKFLAKLIEIQIENHGMYPSWPKGAYRIRRRFSHYTVLYFDNLWYRCHIWLT